MRDSQTDSTATAVLEQPQHSDQPETDLPNIQGGTTHEWEADTFDGSDTPDKSDKCDPSEPAPEKENPAAALQSEIDDQRRRVSDLSVTLWHRTAEAKAAKKELDDAVDELVELEGRLERGEFSLPFTGATVGDSSTESTGSTDPLPGQKELPLSDAPSGTDSTDNSWRAVTLAELGIDGKLAESLTESGLTTLGALADHTAADKRLTDVDGIGPAKAEKIEQACVAYWEKHPRQTVDASTEPTHKPTDAAPTAVAPALPSPPVSTDLTVTAAIDTCDELTKLAQKVGGCDRMEGRLKTIRLYLVEQQEVLPEHPAMFDSFRTALVEKQAAAIAKLAGAESPQETAAYAAGCEAALNGRAVTANPHKMGTRLWKMFDRGWQETEAA